MTAFLEAGGGSGVSPGVEGTQKADLLSAFEHAQQRLADDFEAMRLLCAVGDRCIRAGADEAENIVHILDAAIAIARADKGNIQLLDPASGTLTIVAQRGFEAPFLRVFASVGGDDASACAAALGAREAVVVEDAAESPLYDPQTRAAILEADVRGVLSAPLVSSDGSALGVISTHFRSPHRPSDRDLRFMALLARQAADYLERKRGERELQLMTADQRQIFDSTETGLTRCGRDFTYLAANEAYARMAGLPVSLIVGVPIATVMGGTAFDVVRPHIERVLAGERVAYEAELPFAGSRPIWASVVYTPTRDADGEVVGWLASITDITERRRHEQRQTLLLHELDHRVKNTLATVQSLARQTLRSAASLAAGEAALGARLIALSRAHDVLTQEHWEAASLREVVASALSAYAGGDGGGRFDIEGPEVRLVPKAAVALSLALHELATNAAKHGALTSETGRIRLEWVLPAPGGGDFRLLWAESGGPSVSQPARRGFGSRLIEQGLAHDLGGKVRLAFAPEGLSCLVEAPVGEIAR